MAESFPGNPIGQFSINIRNDKVKVSSTDVTTIVTAVKKAFDGERDDQQLLDIRPGSLHVRCCFTDKRFLEVFPDYESGKIKERLEEEFSNAGIKVEGLKVEIENLAEANETKEAIETSYEDMDKDDAQDDKNQLDTVIMKPLPCDKSAVLEEATSLGLHGPNRSFEKPRAKLLDCIESSMNIERSFNHVSILLVGISGVGKSATVNHLLGLGIEFAKVSDTKSETRSTKEFIIHSNDPEYEAEGLSLGLIDTPGFCDTDGTKQDACNLLSIQKFFTTHPTLSKYYPNLVFLVMKATDKRFEGENSDLGKSLRCVKQLNLVDPKKPNVVTILSHAASIQKKTDEEWTKELNRIKSRVSTFIFNYLKVHTPVVAIENEYEDCGLERCGDYTRLRNGELQPKNLYLACAKLLRNNNDNLGLITLTRVFIEPENPDLPIEHGHEEIAKKANETPLDSAEQAIVELFEIEARGGFKDPFYSKVLEYIHEENLQGWKLEEVIKIAGILKHLGEGNPPNFGSHSIHSIEYFLGKEITSNGQKMLEEKFDIATDPPNIVLESGRLIGQGYNIITGKSVASEVMKFGVATQFGIAIPTCAKLEKAQQSKSLMEEFENELSFTKSRLKSLNVNLAVKPDLIKMNYGAGYNVKADSTSSCSMSQSSFLFEQRMFELKIGNYKECLAEEKMTFTKDFMSAIVNLPDTFDKSDSNCVSEFEKFFNRFGHFLVSSAYCGGSVEVKCKRNVVESEKANLAEVKASLESMLDGFDIVEASVSTDSSTSNSSKSKALLNGSAFCWQGGDISLQTKDTIGDKKKLQKWKESLLQKPVMLTSELTLEPISTAVGCVDSQKEKATYNALKDLLESDIEIPDKEEAKSILARIIAMILRIKNAITREDSAVSPIYKK